MSAVEIVKTFLHTMEARDLESAQAMMSDKAVIVFPNNKTFASQHEMVANAKGRYQWVKKTFDTIDHFTRDDGAEVVYIMGTLYGVNMQDVPFEGIRYIDRFVVKANKIIEQSVWNDLVESGVLTRTNEVEGA